MNLNQFRKSANIPFNIFTAYIREIAQGTKSQGNKFVVEGVNFAEGRGMKEVPKQGKFMLEGTRTGNKLAD
jgi:hypothetical protein